MLHKIWIPFLNKWSVISENMFFFKDNAAVHTVNNSNTIFVVAMCILKST